MGRILALVGGLLITPAAFAANIRCIPLNNVQFSFDGKPHYYFFHVTTKQHVVTHVQMETLADDGSHAESEPPLISGGFIPGDVIVFETAPNGQGLALRAVYQVNAGNYMGSVYFENSTEILHIKCMELKPL